MQERRTATPPPPEPQGSLLHFVRTHYDGSSTSLADTQFSDDPEKFDWELPSSWKIAQGAAINSAPHLPRSQAHYYLSDLAGISQDPDRSSSPSAARELAELEGEAFSSAAETARPDWRAEARESGRAGSFFDYSLARDHLRDRLFYQCQVVTPDVAMLGAATAAIQEFEHSSREYGLLEDDVEEELSKAQAQEELVKAEEADERAMEKEIREVEAKLGIVSVDEED